MQTSTTCLQADELKSFISGELPDQRVTEVEEHISTCDTCRKSLENTAGDRDWWSDVEHALGADPSVAFDESVHDEQQASGYDRLIELLGPTDDPSMMGRIGSYEIVGILGQGGMGAVFKAFDAGLHRYVAIKVLLPHLASSGAARARFRREGQAAAAVIDDHVLPIYAVDQWQGTPYLVMQYTRGVSLQKRLHEQGPLELREILRIGLHAARGLAAAHAQGLVHRDVKPSNILLDSTVERSMLTDFGLARAVDDASLTASGIVAGTPQYMSPEQARAEAIDGRSDLFSLGSILYAMCTGHAPFRAENSIAVLRLIADKQPRPIREINPDIPEWLCAIIGKLMSKQAGDRFDSAERVAELLEGCLAHSQQPTTTPLPDVVAELVKSFDPHGNKRDTESLDDFRYPPFIKFIAAAAFAFSLIFAGVLIVLELNKGTLKIESEADDVPIRVIQGENTVRSLTVNKSGETIRVAAGQYVIEVGGDLNGINVQDSSVSLARGATEVVRIAMAENTLTPDRNLDGRTARTPVDTSDVVINATEVPAETILWNVAGAMFVPVLKEELPASQWKGGLRVTHMRENGPAEDAMLRVGDIVVEIDSKPIESIESISLAWRRTDFGAPVSVRLLRDGQPIVARLKWNIRAMQNDALAKGKVLSRNMHTVVVSLGTDDGVYPGDRLEAGTPYTLGSLEVVTVSADQSVTRIVSEHEGLPVKVGDSVIYGRTKWLTPPSTRDRTNNVAPVDDPPPSARAAREAADVGSSRSFSHFIRRAAVDNQARIHGETAANQQLVLQIEESKHNRALSWNTETKAGPFIVILTRTSVPTGPGTSAPGFTYQIVHDETGGGGTTNVACSAVDPLPNATIHFAMVKPEERELRGPSRINTLRIATLKYPDGTEAPVTLKIRAEGKQVATVLGEPIYEGDIQPNLDDKDNLIRLFTNPLMGHYCMQQGIDRDRELELRIKDPEILLGAQMFVSRWELHRHLYKKYGGRVVLDTFGPFPVDGYRKWLEERQQVGDFAITDPELQAKFDALMNVPEDTRYASPDQIKKVFDPAHTERFIETYAKFPTGAYASLEFAGALIVPELNKGTPPIESDEAVQSATVPSQPPASADDNSTSAWDGESAAFRAFQKGLEIHESESESLWK